jgi:hypothetical protein
VNFSIFNIESRMCLLVDDDVILQMVCDKMRRQGVPVLEQIPPGDFVPPE